MKRNETSNWMKAAVAVLFRTLCVMPLVCGMGLERAARAQSDAVLRPPSVPLVTCDPYFSIWSPADKLTDADTVHWTGKPHRLASQVRIDGKAYRLMGREPANLPALSQTRLEVLPTRTIYTFAAEGVNLTLTFMTAALPEDLLIYSRPVTYLTFEARSTDGKSHNVFADVLVSPEIAVNEPGQSVTWTLTKIGPLAAARIGSTDQPVLQKKGDDLRIDWGYLYVAAPELKGETQANGKGGSFYSGVFLADTSRLPVDARMGFFHDFRGRETNLPAAQAPTPLVGLDLKIVAGKPAADWPMPDLKAPELKSASRWLMLAYDDEYSIQYFGKNLRPYWRRNGDSAAMLLMKAAAEYEVLKHRCEQFDEELMADLRKAGGEKYAQLCALAYRQCYAANKVVADTSGRPLMFPKENFSNGCIGTVDVIYPMAPQFLLFSPALTRAMLVPILDYASSPRWKFPFAPHDLGTYPLANGQVYGGGEKTEENQMPVEETGNLLILLAALAQVEGNAQFCDPYWPVLVKWADYLKAKGFDPENQLCTDDFAGHLAHNVNLSAKAILGLASFARLCALRGDTNNAVAFRDRVEDYAHRWGVEAQEESGNFRLAFDKPGTWSQKYNAVWDRILDFGLAPEGAWTAEMAAYKSHLNDYGLPLDNRKDYTKLDWTVWTATLTQDRADFDALIDAVYRWVNETPSRVPLTDWYDTKTGKQEGFQARSVVGGVFLQVLYDRPVWKKWAARGQRSAR